MKLSVYISLFLFLQSFILTAKNKTAADTAVARILAMKDDTVKAQKFYLLAKQSGNTDIQKTVFCLIQSLEVAQKIKFHSGYRKSADALVNFLINNEMYEAAGEYGIKTYDYFLKHGHEEDKAKIAGMLGSVFIKTEKYPLALLYLNIKGENDLKKEDFKSYAFTLQQKGRIYFEKNNFDSALVNTLWSGEIFKRNNMSSEFASSLLTLGKIFFEHDNRQKAEEKINEAMEIFLANNDRSGIMNTWISKALVYSGSGVKDSAFYCYNKALVLADSLHSAQTKREILKTLAELSEQTKDYKASLEYQLAFKKIDDSLNVFAQKTRNLELEIKIYLTENKVLEKDKELELAEKQKKFIVLLLFIIGFLLISYYRVKTLKK